MYHYVRDLARSRYPRIKGRSIEEFDAQLDYIAATYRACSLAEVRDAIRGSRPLPQRACLLSFDDGFRDHRDHVVPRLLARGWTGAFFPPARPIERRCVLDVHKIHFILATVSDSESLVDDALRLVANHRAAHRIPDDATLRRQFAGESRFDPPSIVFLKRLLQHGLPADVRSAVVDALFHAHVTRDESTFADELYMTVGDLREMAGLGMEIGGHGDRHDWLGHLLPPQQREEIDETIAFLRRVSGREPSDWTMCYPYGSYNAATLDILRQSDCAIGLTTHVGINASLARPLELSRLDTNDLPFAPRAMSPPSALVTA